MSTLPPNEPFTPEGPVTPEQPRKGRGCFFYGCVTVIVLAVITAGGIFVGVRFLTGKFNEYVQAYTEPAPRPLPPLNMPEAERKEVVKRADDFRQRIDEPPTPDHPRVLTDEERTLVLSADDINALLEENSDLKGKFHVTLEGGEAGVQLSIPLPDFPLLKGRYLNGEAKVIPKLVNGDIHFLLRDIRVKGQPLPEEMRKMFEDKDLVEEAAKNPKNRAQVSRLTQNRKFDQLEIKDGKLIVVARKEPNASATPPGEVSGSATSKDKAEDDDDAMPKPEGKAKPDDSDEPAPEAKPKEKTKAAEDDDSDAPAPKSEATAPDRPTPKDAPQEDKP